VDGDGPPRVVPALVAVELAGEVAADRRFDGAFEVGLGSAAGESAVGGVGPYVQASTGRCTFPPGGTPATPDRRLRWPRPARLSGPPAG
jgi:hypothetical protein